MLAGEGIERNARRQADLDARSIHLVDWRGDIKAGVVDEVDGRRRRNAGRRRRRVLTLLAGDFSDDAGKRRFQHGSAQRRASGLDASLGGGDLGRRGATGSFAHFRLALHLVHQCCADETLRHQLPLPRRLAPRRLRGRAGLVATGFGRAGLLLAQPNLRGQIDIPKLQQDLPGADSITFLDQQARNLAAALRRQFGAPTGLDGAGAGVGDCRLDTTERNFRDIHFQRLRLAVGMPAVIGGSQQRGNNEKADRP